MTFKSLLRGIVISSLIIGCSGGGGGGSTGPGVNPSPPPAPPPPPPPASPGASNIVVSNNTYTPSTQSISRGTTVNWTWNTCSGEYGYEQTCARHTVTFDDGQSSPELDQGSYSRTFNAAGQYKYHCTIHGQAMSGTITVQ